MAGVFIGVIYGSICESCWIVGAGMFGRRFDILWGRVFLYSWVLYTAVEMSKLLPIFFWADKFDIWLITFVSLSNLSGCLDFSSGYNIWIRHYTMLTISVLAYPFRYTQNFYLSKASLLEIKFLSNKIYKVILPAFFYRW